MAYYLLSFVAESVIVPPVWRCDMPRVSPYTILLNADERSRLQQMAGKYPSPYCDVIRAKIVLLAAEGLGNDEIGQRLDIPRQIVSKWRKRFFQERLDGLCDLPRSGKPSGFSPQTRRGDQGVGL